jgi:hypothetical protein
MEETANPKLAAQRRQRALRKQALAAVHDADATLFAAGLAHSDFGKHKRRAVYPVALFEAVIRQGSKGVSMLDPLLAWSPMLRTATVQAVAHVSPMMLKHLLARGADVYGRLNDMGPLSMAARVSTSPEMFSAFWRPLLATGANPQEREMSFTGSSGVAVVTTPMKHAINHGFEAIAVSLILEARAQKTNEEMNDITGVAPRQACVRLRI